MGTSSEQFGKVVYASQTVRDSEVADRESLHMMRDGRVRLSCLMRQARESRSGIIALPKNKSRLEKRLTSKPDSGLFADNYAINILGHTNIFSSMLILVWIGD